jgi:tRNA threonylcarbamoyladenosine biosynthesis protein TsaB
MKLLIDTTSSEKIVLRLGDTVYETESRRENSQRLLPFILEVLEKEHITVSDIHSIEVAQGNGSFTGIRLGISVANALGWALQIPVNGKRPDKGEFAPISYS